MSKRLRKGDQVKLISGKYKGKVSTILRIQNDRVFVDGVNLVKKTVRKRKQEDEEGIVEVEAPVHISNVMLVSKSGKRSRIRYDLSEGKKKRIAIKTGEILS